jgi:hypothetical protein
LPRREAGDKLCLVARFQHSTTPIDSFFVDERMAYFPLTRIWSNDMVMGEFTVLPKPPHVGAHDSCSQVLLPETYCIPE